jgi:hypothetical protein
MRVLVTVGFSTMLMLVQGCSSDEPPAGEEPTPGEQSPGGEENNGGETTPPAANPPTSAETTTPAPAEPAKPEKSKMTFFVTSTGSGAQGGNLGGLEGADKKCQSLATAVNGGDHTWHAYLSVQGKPAKDRIGTGPWVNQKGKTIAADVAALHALQFLPPAADLVDEKGAAVPANRRLILTGSKQDGTPAATCNNWTSNAANNNGRSGDVQSDTSVVLGVHWNDAVKSTACTQAALNAAKGEGRLYCFAID